MRVIYDLLIKVTYVFQVHQTFYLSTVFFIFVAVMALQVPKLKASDNLKMISFVCWAAYGIIPTGHWVSVMGGWENPIVAVSELRFGQQLKNIMSKQLHFRFRTNRRRLWFCNDVYSFPPFFFNHFFY